MCDGSPAGEGLLPSESPFDAGQSAGVMGRPCLKQAVLSAWHFLVARDKQLGHSRCAVETGNAHRPAERG